MIKRINVEKIGDRIVVKFPYNKNYVEKVKTIEGHWWNIEENIGVFQMLMEHRNDFKDF